MKKFLKWFGLSIAALAVLLVLAVSICLSPKVLTGFVTKSASYYFDSSLQIGKVRATLLRHFPNLSVELDDVSVTYPHDRFASYDGTGAGSPLLKEGCGEIEDTLFTAGRIHAQADYIAFLTRKKLNIKKVELEGLRAFAHKYDSTSANWDVIVLPVKTDTTSSPVPPISVKKVHLSGVSELVYTDQADTLFGGLRFRDFDIDLSGSLVDGLMDSEGSILLDADAHFQNALLGRLEAPVRIESQAGVSIGEATGIEVRPLVLSIAELPLKVEGKAVLAGDSTFVKAGAEIVDCPIGQIISEYGAHFLGLLSDLRTDARMTLTADADGWFGSASGLLPDMNASLEIPDSHISYVNLVEDGEFDLTLDARTTAGKLLADLKDLCFAIKGVDLNAKGTADDLLGGDPLFDVSATACTQFADLVKYLPPESGIQAEGDVDVELDGSFKLSELTLRKINQTHLKGHIFSDGLRFSIPSDTLYAYASHPDIRINTTGSSAGAGATVDSIRFIAGAATYIMGKALNLNALSKGHRQPATADVAFESLNLRGADSLALGIRNSSSHLALGSTVKDGVSLPTISLASTEKTAFLQSGPHKATIASTEIDATLQKRAARSRQRVRAPGDTLSARRSFGDTSARSRRVIPDYLKEVDFRKKDLSFTIGEGITGLFRKWVPEAKLKIGYGTAATPALPLQNTISNFSGELTDDRLNIRSLNVNSGSSDLAVNGSLLGLRPVLTGRSRSRFYAVLDLRSKMLNANEILAAINAGGSASEEAVIIDTLENAEEQLDYSLIVVPGNLNANISIELDSVRYSSIGLSSFHSDIKMRERCLQIANTAASSPLGNLALDAFYSTVTKSDINAGFNVRLDAVTADHLIEVVPAIDSLVPMLKSFKGNLDCELAATTQLDTNMNILIPTINGIAKISGSGLELTDTGDLRKIARLLMFKDSKVGHIDDMSVSGLISNNTLEIFPFILGIDRYTLGLSGQQGFDTNFKYHISVIKSPIPFKFGINLKGNFDKWNFRLGRAKYRSTSIPLFTPMVDTMQVNLASSIKNIFKKGAEAAIREYERDRDQISARIETSGIKINDDDDDDELTPEELEQIDNYRLEMECEAESEALEKELNAMFEEDLSQILAGISSSL